MSRAPAPSDNAMDCAADWLDSYEEGTPEGDKCRAVAQWLRDQIDARQLRTYARGHGVPVAKLREVMARKVNPVT